jgi:hypothetical protein
MKLNRSFVTPPISEATPIRLHRRRTTLRLFVTSAALIVSGSLAATASASAAGKANNAKFCADVKTYGASNDRIPSEFSTDDVVPPNFRADTLEVASVLDAQFKAVAAGVTTKGAKRAMVTMTPYMERRYGKLLAQLQASTDDLTAYQAVGSWSAADFFSTPKADLTKLIAAGKALEKEVTQRCGK